MLSFCNSYLYYQHKNVCAKTVWFHISCYNNKYTKTPPLRAVAMHIVIISPCLIFKFSNYRISTSPHFHFSNLTSDLMSAAKKFPHFQIPKFSNFHIIASAHHHIFTFSNPQILKSLISKISILSIIKSYSWHGVFIDIYLDSTLIAMASRSKIFLFDRNKLKPSAYYFLYLWAINFRISSVFYFSYGIRLNRKLTLD